MNTFGIFEYIWDIWIHVGYLNTFGIFDYFWDIWMNLGYLITFGIFECIWDIWIHLGYLNTFGIFDYFWDIWIHVGYLNTWGIFEYIWDIWIHLWPGTDKTMIHNTIILNVPVIFLSKNSTFNPIAIRYVKIWYIYWSLAVWNFIARYLVYSPDDVLYAQYIEQAGSVPSILNRTNNLLIAAPNICLARTVLKSKQFCVYVCFAAEYGTAGSFEAAVSIWDTARYRIRAVA